MVLSEFEQKRCEKAVKVFIDQRRPPPHIRKELDLGYRFKNQSVEIFEIRPKWRSPGDFMEHSVAKATFVKTENVWKIYWQRADLKWHQYVPCPSVSSIEEFLSIVDRDEHACFFG
jgi:hypothetical protein